MTLGAMLSLGVPLDVLEKGLASLGLNEFELSVNEKEYNGSLVTDVDVILYNKGRMTRTRMMREFFSYLGKVRDFDRQIERYWDRHEKNISAWYLVQKRPDDLIISAAPSCIIEPIARRLGVNCVCTEYDRESGVFLDNLMYAKGKSRYMIDHGFPVIDNFYSDSLADTPIALCAEKAHFVTDKAQTVTDWPHLDPETMKEVRRKINSGWTIHI